MNIQEFTSQIGLQLILLNGRKECRSLSRVYTEIKNGRNILRNVRKLNSEMKSFPLVSTSEIEIRNKIMNLCTEFEKYLLSISNSSSK